MGILAIADDEPEDLKAIKSALPAEHPFTQLDEFETEDTLLEYIDTLETANENDLPCLFVLDLNIGTQNSGHRALKAIRGSEKLKHIPILIASVSDRKKTIRELYDDGVNSFIPKGTTQEISDAFAHVFSYWTNVVALPCEQR